MIELVLYPYYMFLWTLLIPLPSMANQESLSSIVWQKLRKRGSAMLGLWIILIALVLAIFAYTIIPDNTPNANRQLPEIALQPPLFNTDFIKYQNAAIQSDKSWWKSLFTGYESNMELIPYKKLEIIDSELQITNHYGQIRILPFNDIGLGPMSRKDLIAKHGTSKKYWLGTDRYGRDIMSRLILGIRVSLTVGLLAVIISVFIGIFLGSISGYFGGWLDQAISFLINVSWSIPTLLLVFAIVLALGRGVGIIFLAVGLTMWVDVARIVRGQVLQQKNMQYVQAAKSIGLPEFPVLARHILPNIVGPILVIAAANFATAILIEAGLSYLGFGIRPPAPSIGNMLNEQYGFALSGKPFLALVPAITIMLLVLAFNLIGTGLRDAFDVKDNK